MEKLVFGSEEWISELKNRVTFPKTFVVYYGIHKETSETILNAVALGTKSTEPKNLKLGTLTPTLGMALSPYKWLIINAYHIKSADEYLGKMTELGKHRGVDFNN